MTSIWRREGNVLVPSDDEALADLHAHKDGSEMRVTLSGARNPKQHRLFFALVKIVAEQDPAYNGNTGAARNDILRNLRHVEWEVDRDGRVQIWPKSISYASMTQAEFNELFQNAVNLICQWLGTAPQQIIDEVNAMVADKRYEGMRRW